MEGWRTRHAGEVYSRAASVPANCEVFLECYIGGFIVLMSLYLDEYMKIEHDLSIILAYSIGKGKLKQIKFNTRST